MKFELRQINEDMAAHAKEFLEIHGHTCGEGGIPVQWEPDGEEVLGVCYDGSCLKIRGYEKVHFYRGLHLFMMRAAAGGCSPFEKKEKICFKETGLMLDCSRNGTADKTLIKEIIRSLAACGISQLYLYMEDVYEIPEDPYFGAFRGKYTFDDLKEIDGYGQSLGVEVIPAIQTLAHLHTYLRWPKAAPLKDTEDILLVGTKETEAFVRSMIRSASRPFSTKKIHVGMDEADLLGLGRYLRDNGYEERYGIMNRHLRTVCGICRELGLEPMIWSDMFFRLKSPTGDYYDLPEETEFDMKEKIPDDITLVYWDYYQHKAELYEKNIRLHRKLTDRIRFAGGGWTWNGIAPNYSKAEATLSEGVKACRTQGIDQALCTFWFDNGTETPVRTLYYSAVYFAQLCYGEEKAETELDAWLKLLTGCGAGAFRLLDRFDCTAGTKKENENADNPSKYIFYQDVLIGLFDGQIKGMGLDLHYKNLGEKLKKAVEEAEDTVMKDVFSYYQTLADILAEKAGLGLEVKAAYDREDRIEMEKLCRRIEGCADMAAVLRRKREKIWFSECRPFGYEVLDIRFGGVEVRLRSAARRLRLWTGGGIGRVEELEERRLPYVLDEKDENHRMCAGGFWQNLVSAGNIAGI